jgi:hypothetical protein
MRPFFACLLLFVSVAPALAAGNRPFSRCYRFPAARQYVAIAEGAGEPPGRGSYAVRIYGGADPQRPRSDFIVGSVRARSGAIEEVAFRDLDADGFDEVVVVMRQPGPAGLLAADAIGYRSGVLYLLEGVADLPAEADPVAALKKALDDCDCHKD